ncbi:hypothetical protein SAY87_010727 [Trapa incisa]|uniref:Uncharacterized protein n=1 Tax=Trapa incisa TaxID=236973 RepID=A0AAN7JIE2_9MYRT|nr:hypothetical protein SAY87_010727 [Trapa incisa]
MKRDHRGFQPTEAAAAGAGYHLEDKVDDLTLLPADYYNPTMMARGIKQVTHEILQSSSVPYNYDGHLPQLFSPDAVIPNLSITDRAINGSNNNNDDLLEGSHNLLRLTASSGNVISSLYGPSDWSLLDKLLGSTSQHHQHPAQGNQGKPSTASFGYPCSCSQGGVMDGASDAVIAQPPPPRTLFPFQFQSCSSSSSDLPFKFPK